MITECGRYAPRSTVVAKTGRENTTCAANGLATAGNPYTTPTKPAPTGPCQVNALLEHGQRVAAKPKSLAPNNKTGRRSSGSASAPVAHRSSRPNQHQPAADDEPRRRAILAFALLVGRFLRYGDLAVPCALKATGRSNWAERLQIWVRFIARYQYLELCTARCSIEKNYLKLKRLRSICFYRHGRFLSGSAPTNFTQSKLNFMAQMRFPFISSRIDVSIFI